MQVCKTSSAVTPDLVTHSNFLFLLIGAELTNQSLLLRPILEGQHQRVHHQQEHGQTCRGQWWLEVRLECLQSSVLSGCLQFLLRSAPLQTVAVTHFRFRHYQSDLPDLVKHFNGKSKLSLFEIHEPVLFQTPTPIISHRTALKSAFGLYLYLICIYKLLSKDFNPINTRKNNFFVPRGFRLSKSSQGEEVTGDKGWEGGPYFHYNIIWQCNNLTGLLQLTSF